MKAVVQAPYAIHWFRRDLRLDGNPALTQALKEFDGRVVGLFCFDKKFLGRPDFSPARFQFFLETLKLLRDEMTARGGQLICLDVGPDEGFSLFFQKLKEVDAPLPAAVTFNRDYEPFARARDGRMERRLLDLGVQVRTERDHLLIEPQELFREGDPALGYKVFTPFYRRWRQLLETRDVQDRLRGAMAAGSHRVRADRQASFSSEVPDVAGRLPDLLEVYRRENLKAVAIPIPEAGRQAARQALKAFSGKVSQYDKARDFPATAATSQLSIFLKNGSLTVAEVIAGLALTEDKRHEGFLRQLAWREFYYHILARFPDVENQAFIPKFRTIPWQNREDWFAAWKSGQTGFPIVDAGMRQLNETGWMHNRVRMIVASFLVKDLLIDWRWGERYFMEKLLDGDLAANNGGWQWAASTGCDPQPYFRIFNPTSQSQKFDSSGEYIRTYVPELRKLSAKAIHEPPASERGSYPAPMVNHKEQREAALRIFKQQAAI